jgi:hypothetical protein
MGLGAAFAVAPAVLGALCLGIGQVGWLLLGGLLTAAGLATVPVVRWAVRSRPFPLASDVPVPDAEQSTPEVATAPIAVRPPARRQPSLEQITVRIPRKVEYVVLEDNSRFILDRDCVVGRDPLDCDAARSGLRAIRIDDRANRMSRAHLEIRRVDGRVFIIDRQSKNRPAGQSQWIRIAPWKPIVWLPGMSVRIGSRILGLEAAGERPTVRNEPIIPIEVRMARPASIQWAAAAAPPSSAPTVRMNHADKCGHAVAAPPSRAPTVRINHGRAVAAPPSSAPTVRINHADRWGHAMATPSAAPRKTGPVAAMSERNAI